MVVTYNMLFWSLGCLYYGLCVKWGFHAISQWRRARWSRLAECVRQKELELAPIVPFQRQDGCDRHHPLILFMYTFFGIFFVLPVRLLGLIVFGSGCVVFLRLVLAYCAFCRRAKKWCFHTGRDTALPLEVENRLPLWAEMIFKKLSRAVLFWVGLWRISEHHHIGPLQSVPASESSSIIVSNHVSPLDILYFMSQCFPSFLSKASVKNLPIVAPFANSMHCLYVDRGDQSDRNRVLKEIQYRQDLQRLCASTASTHRVPPPLVLFPEGTTSSGQSLLPFKRGAFVSLQPVRPVGKEVRAQAFLLIHWFFHPSFEVLDGLVWFGLLLLNVSHTYAIPEPGFIRLDVFWLPEEVPPSLEEASKTILPSIMSDGNGDEKSQLQQRRIYSFMVAVRRKMWACLQKVSLADVRPEESMPSPMATVIEKDVQEFQKDRVNSLDALYYLDDTWDDALETKRKIYEVLWPTEETQPFCFSVGLSRMWEKLFQALNLMKRKERKTQ